MYIYIYMTKKCFHVYSVYLYKKKHSKIDKSFASPKEWKLKRNKCNMEECKSLHFQE